MLLTFLMYLVYYCLCRILLNVALFGTHVLNWFLVCWMSAPLCGAMNAIIQMASVSKFKLNLPGFTLSIFQVDFQSNFPWQYIFLPLLSLQVSISYIQWPNTKATTLIWNVRALRQCNVPYVFPHNPEVSSSEHLGHHWEVLWVSRVFLTWLYTDLRRFKEDTQELGTQLNAM